MADGFPTPQDAEDAFYDAFEAHDLSAMMGAWADTDDLVCIQPMGPLVQGREAVAGVWKQVFAHAETPHILVHHRQWAESPDLAVHVVEEKLTFPGVAADLPAMIATNVYRRDAGGWRMVLHQASPPPPPRG
jgi:ketosteroid isomerase-like protein